MEQSYLFIIIGVLLLAVLIGATVWTNRREKSRVFSNTFSTRAPSSPIPAPNVANVPASNTTQEPLATQAEQNAPVYTEQEVVESVKNIKISLPDQGSPEPSQPVAPQQAVENQHYFDNQANAPEPIQSPVVDVAEPAVAEPEPAVENHIISLYVVAPQGQQFHGQFVVQHLEALGFQYGEYQIFHRHLDSTSTSPVLFSVANMMQPGIFDLSQIEQFQTVGLVFFMHLPSAGNDLVNLRSMIRTAETFAQAVGGFVLNDQQQLFDEQSRQDYLLRVK